MASPPPPPSAPPLGGEGGDLGFLLNFVVYPLAGLLGLAAFLWCTLRPPSPPRDSQSSKIAAVPVALATWNALPYRDQAALRAPP